MKLDVTNDTRVQSPYLYLQSAGSTGQDGSAPGIYNRWEFLRNLGETHLAKGNEAAGRLNFNRPDDFVMLYRTPYGRKFPTIIDFKKHRPDVINHDRGYWIFLYTNTQTVVYLHFRDPSLYDQARAVSPDPGTDAMPFLAAYGPGLMEAEVKDTLFFAAEFEVEGAVAGRELRVEALSAVENIALSPVFVSCRQHFHAENWCGETGEDQEVPKPDECRGRNLIPNPGFELGNQGFSSEYGYDKAAPGFYFVTNNPRAQNGGWRGRPHSGELMMAVDGHVKENRIVWEVTVPVEPGANYLFSGWLCSLYASSPARLRLTITGADDQSQSVLKVNAPKTVAVWENMRHEWHSGRNSQAVLTIRDDNLQAGGNDFGLDSFCFCKMEPDAPCRPRIHSENIRSVRFDVPNGLITGLYLETYDAFIRGSDWTPLGNFALSLDIDEVKHRLENSNYPVHGRWPKFSADSPVNTQNYRNRWKWKGGLADGVDRYIKAGNSDPRARDVLQADNLRDGSMSVSYLDMLNLVALDFHAARQLGRGHIDTKMPSRRSPYVYLAAYLTEGRLDDGTQRSITHYSMGVPTSIEDERLPDKPVLKAPRYGLFSDNGSGKPINLTDGNGYSHDGKARFVNLYVRQEETSPSLGPFFDPPELFCSIDKTASVFFGINYRKKGEPDWRRPEIAHHDQFKDSGNPPAAETNPIPNHGREERPVLTHRETEDGVALYTAYGINWFSRASAPGNTIQTDKTEIPRAKTLLPPANFQVQLIQAESPLMLTTADEQTRLQQLTDPDKTLLRVTFDYYVTHDLNYAFADRVVFFFRTQAPRNILGKVISVADDSSNPSRVLVRTAPYVQNSTGQVVVPVMPAKPGNYLGGVFTAGPNAYIIDALTPPGASGEGPVFTLRKIEDAVPVSPGGGNAFTTAARITVPQPDELFMAVENMAHPDTWGLPNPPAKTVQLGDPSWNPVTESVTRDGETRQRLLRGIWEDAMINHKPDTQGNLIGVYDIVFQTYTLNHHVQAGDPEPVDWYKGIVRVPNSNDPNGPRIILEVIKTAHIGDGQPLHLTAFDPAFDTSPNPVPTGNVQRVNYYPGYRVYLKADSANGFDETTILPASGEGYRKTWLGARAHDTAEGLASPIGVPAPILALEFVEPLAPEQPMGPRYATWPDFDGKATWTFSLSFKHKPFAVAFYRASETALLEALYKPETVEDILEQLALLGEDDPDRARRWGNLVHFDLDYDVAGTPYYDPGGTNPNGAFRRFPAEPGNFRFPKPDNPEYFDGTGEPGQVLDEVKQAIRGAFTPMTQQPLIYDYIKGGNYRPTAQKQTIRDNKGNLLDPNDPAFVQAPMAKRTGVNEISFADFTLDGAANNFYFYYAREIGNRNKLGEPGPIAGPVLLIDTSPPEAPQIRQMVSRTPDAAVLFSLNGFPEKQNVRRLVLYRTLDGADALSIRTMQPLKTLDLEAEGLVDAEVIEIVDSFDDGFVPYGDTIYYRFVGLRRVRDDRDKVIWVPSQPSKLLLTTVVDSINPEPPGLSYHADPISGSPAVIDNVVLQWAPTAYNGTYFLEKMTSIGTWQKIADVRSNDPLISVNLAATELGSGTLAKETDDGDVRYHRFRVKVENASGLFNLTYLELTI
ncbi:MAG: hypothetical protein QNK37_04700 [Acidobacteriota bacterium]|nr:hypothetical protein [Acidobacteriota bacterium]